MEVISSMSGFGQREYAHARLLFLEPSTHSQNLCGATRLRLHREFVNDPATSSAHSREDRLGDGDLKAAQCILDGVVKHNVPGSSSGLHFESAVRACGEPKRVTPRPAISAKRTDPEALKLLENLARPRIALVGESRLPTLRGGKWVGWINR